MAAAEGEFRVAQIDHVHLFVSDRREAAAWYERILGFKIVRDFEAWAVPGGPLIISPDDGNTKLALFESKRADEPNTEPKKTVACRTDAEGFCRFLERLARHPVFDESGKSVSTLKVVDHDLAFSVYFNDSAGNSLELTTYDCDTVSRKRAEGHGANR